MAHLYVSVYSYLAHDAGGKPLPVPQEPSIAEWALDFFDNSATSPAFPDAARFVMLVADDSCLVKFFSDKFDSGEKPIWAGERLFFGVHPGHKLVVVGR